MCTTDDWQQGWRYPDRGAAFVLNGPSGVGKSTISRHLVATIPGVAFSVSLTTRPPAPGETHGVDYVFTDRQDFEERIRRKQMLEYVELYGNYYGTSLDATRHALRRGDSLLYEVNTHGLAQMHKHQLDPVTIMLLPPSMDELRRRLTARNRDTPEKIAERMKEAERELTHRPLYDYLVVNDHLATAKMQVQSIVIAALSRRGCRYRLLGPDAGDVLHEP